VLSNDFVNPYSHQTNVGFSHQLAPDLAIHVDAVYTQVRSDRKLYNINLPDPVTRLRPYPEFNRIDLEESISKSNYKGLYTRLDKRFSRNYQFLVSYSFVNSKDNAPAGRFTDENNFGIDYGPANAERRHSLVASGGVMLPYGIQIGALWTLRTSLPFSAGAGTDLNGNGFVTDYVPGTTRNQGHRDLDLALVNAWRAASNLAPVTEDDLDSTRFTSVDLRASKTFTINGSRRLELLAQVFNVFNTVNLTGLQTNARATTFGRASRASAGTQAELAVRFMW
jgi:hypothetical protein